MIETNLNPCVRKEPKTYADITRDVVIIKPKSQQDSEVTNEEIKKNFKPASLEVGMVQIKNIKDGGVVKCESKEDSIKIKDAAVKKLKKKYDIKLSKLINPSIKILYIEEELDEDELLDAILSQNANIQHDDLEIKLKVMKKMKARYMCIVEIDPLTYDRMMEKGKLSIGWSVCRVFEYIHVFRCFSCFGFNCTMKDRCNKCASVDHQIDNCESDVWSCVNCVNANQTLKMNFSTDHSPFSIECPCLQRKMNMERRKIVQEKGNK